MKRIFVLAALFVCVALFAATAKRLYVTWDDQPDYSEDTNIIFFIYTQTNATLPVSGWSVWTNISVLDWTAAGRKVEIPTATTSKAFFVVTASNLYGESDFSAVVASRRLAPAKNPKIGTF